MRPGLFLEHVLVGAQSARLIGARPGVQKLLLRKVFAEPTLVQCHSVEHAVLFVTLLDQVRHHFEPVLFEPQVSRHIDGDAEILHQGDGVHEPATMERLDQPASRCAGCPSLGPYPRQQAIQKRCESLDVSLAIAQKVLLLLLGERRAADRQIPQFRFLGVGVPVDVADLESSPARRATRPVCRPGSPFGL